MHVRMHVCRVRGLKRLVKHTDEDDRFAKVAHTCITVRAYTCASMHAYACTHVYASTRVHAYTHIYIYIYIYIYACTNII